MNEVTLKLDPKDVDFILNVLATQPLPLVQTQPLVQKIVAQANAKNPDAASDNG